MTIISIKTKSPIQSIGQRMMFASARILAETGVRLILEAVDLLSQSGRHMSAARVLRDITSIHDEFNKKAQP